ncbi:MAG: phosphoadenosine phosphosulfate reductase family protein [Desulfovibrio sp.]
MARTDEHTLDQKLDYSLFLMRGLLDKVEQGVDGLTVDQVAVAWTGGKDSTIALWMWRAVLQEKGLGGARALTIDTGLKFPEIVEFREKVAEEWGVDVAVVRPEVNIKEYPVAEDKVQCCSDLKIAPLKKGLVDHNIKVLITGIRSDEHESRADRMPIEMRDEPEHTLLNPILEWSEMDVWSFNTSKMIPYCDLYNHGYRSLGCMPCTAMDNESERGGRSAEKDNQLGQLSSLGYF